MVVEMVELMVVLMEKKWAVWRVGRRVGGKALQRAVSLVVKLAEPMVANWDAS